jgi:hypothetical protein
MVWTKIVEKIKNMFNKFCSENRVVYEIMWKSTAQPGRPQMRFLCWINNATRDADPSPPSSAEIKNRVEL